MPSSDHATTTPPAAAATSGAPSVNGLPGLGPTPPTPPRSRLGVLRHRHFRNVWIGAFGSSIGSWMESTGIRWIIGQTTGSAIILSYLTAAQMVPILILGISGGLVADRVNRKTLLLITQGTMMVIAAALTVTSYLGHATPGVLIGLSLVQGITMAFNVPAWQVLTPRLVPREDLTSAIHLNGLQFNLARVIGPALAGGVMTVSVAHGATLLFVLNTLSFLGVLLAISGTPDAPAPPHDGTSAWERTRAALSFVFHSRGPRTVFLAIVLFAMLAGPLLTMLPLFVTEVYRLEAGTFGMLLAVMGAGAVAAVGALKFIPRWYPKHHSIPLAVLGGGTMVTLLCTTTSPVLAGVCLFFAGGFWLLTFNQAFAAMQLLVDDRMRGRAMAICNTAAFGATPLGAIIAGELSHLEPWTTAPNGLGVRVGVGSLGAVLALGGLVMLIWRTPEVDGLMPGDPGYDRHPGFWRGITALAHRPRPATDCPRCFYDRRGLPIDQPCPECGFIDRRFATGTGALDPNLPTEPEAPGQI